MRTVYNLKIRNNAPKPMLQSVVNYFRMLEISPGVAWLFVFLGPFVV